MNSVIALACLGDLTGARESLRAALRSDRSDAYSNDFLGSVYFLQDNYASALKYWNHVGKPVVENVRIDPPLRTDSLLLNRAFAFSRGGVLSQENYRTTQSRLEATG